MATVQRFEDLEAWKTARRLTNLIYDLTENKDFAKNYALKDQIQRAAVSVMSNISEGFESRTQHLFIDMLGRAKASAGEVRAQLYVALDRGFVSQEQFEAAYACAVRVAGQVQSLMRYLGSRPNTLRVKEGPADYGPEPST